MMWRADLILASISLLWTLLTLVSASYPGGPDTICFLVLFAFGLGLVIQGMTRAMYAGYDREREPARRSESRRSLGMLTVAAIGVWGGCFLAIGLVPLHLRFMASEPALTGYARRGSHAAWAGLFHVEGVERIGESVWLQTGTSWTSKEGLVFSPSGTHPAYHSDDSETRIRAVNRRWFTGSRTSKYLD